MLGMGLGMLLAHVTRGHALGVWVSFLSLTIFHMYGECIIPIFIYFFCKKAFIIEEYYSIMRSEEYEQKVCR